MRAPVLRAGVGFRAFACIAAWAVGCAAPDRSAPAEASGDLPTWLDAASARPLVLEEGAFGTRPAARASRSPRLAARVSIPARAGAPFVVTELRTGMTVAVRALVPASGGSRERIGPMVVERDSHGAPRVVFRATPQGVEDYIRVDDAGAEPVVHFELDVSRIAGMRLFGHALELVDAAGTPRLRAHVPEVIDANGQRRTARLDVEDCQVDRSPVPPWGRRVTRPGASACTLAVRWDPAGLAHPLWVDPYWAATEGQLSTRHVPGAVGARLQDGRVLYLGGRLDGDVGLDTNGAELFDPVTRTWSPTSPTRSYGFLPKLAVLADGRALLVVGDIPPVPQTYDAGTGTWTELLWPILPKHNDQGALVALDDGDALYVVAETGAAIFDHKTDGWHNITGRNPAVIQAGTKLASGEVLLLGVSPDSGPECAMFRPEAKHPFHECEFATFVPAGLALSHLADDKVIAAGGMLDGVPQTATYELDPVEGWRGLGGLPVALLPPVPLVDGTRFIVGGTRADWEAPTSETWTSQVDPVEWTPAEALPEQRAGHLAIALEDGRILVAGGASPEGELLSAYVRVPGAGEGAACSAGEACDSGHCVDGVCCDSTCGDACWACSAASNVAGVDGVCGPALECAGCGSNLDCSEGQYCDAARRCVSAGPVAAAAGCAVVRSHSADGVPWLLLALSAFGRLASSRRTRRATPELG